jgi:hypothetical protein
MEMIYNIKIHNFIFENFSKNFVQTCFHSLSTSSSDHIESNESDESNESYELNKDEYVDLSKKKIISYYF